MQDSDFGQGHEFELSRQLRHRKTLDKTVQQVLA